MNIQSNQGRILKRGTAVVGTPAAPVAASATATKTMSFSGGCLRKAQFILRRAGTASRGQTMVEFALVAPLYLLLTFAVIDFGRAFFVRMNLQQTVQDAARFASTGNHLSDPKNPGNNLSRVNSILAKVQQSAIGAGATSAQVSSLQGGNNSAGGPGDTVTVSLVTNLKLMTPMVARLFPNGAYTFTSSATFKNEPFSPSNTM